MPVSNIAHMLDHMVNPDTPTIIKQSFEQLILGQLSDIEITALLIALKTKGETQEDLLALTQAMLSHATPLHLDPNIPLVDCTGTGGDGHNTYNISTLTSIVLATYGLKTAKHGNMKVSGHCGSADILKLAGVNIHLDSHQAKHCLEKTNFCFLLAPDYHPGARHAKKVRNALKTKTIFNIVGPLVNPARPQHQLIGVYDPKLLLPMAHVLQHLGVKRAMVIHGSGLDEMAIHGPTFGYELDHQHIYPISYEPESFGITTTPIDHIISQSAQENLDAFIRLLQGKGSPALQAAVALNAGTLLYLSDHALNIRQGIQKIMPLLSADKPFQKLLHIGEVSHHA